ncbi:predicted protein [Chaetoceros tenuissimus]|uniref:DUF19 domain-containing protein n=1 Tax=Chaetoceros tenuissimus TaxID=426638 RepID=A0AAD3CPV1_9STRA|nr:predicted protein [Chaetoceros tenuissimus]
MTALFTLFALVLPMDSEASLMSHLRKNNGDSSEIDIANSHDFNERMMQEDKCACLTGIFQPTCKDLEFCSKALSHNCFDQNEDVQTVYSFHIQHLASIANMVSFDSETCLKDFFDSIAGYMDESCSDGYSELCATGEKSICASINTSEGDIIIDNLCLSSGCFQNKYFLDIALPETIQLVSQTNGKDLTLPSPSQIMYEKCECFNNIRDSFRRNACDDFSKCENVKIFIVEIMRNHFTWIYSFRLPICADGCTVDEVSLTSILQSEFDRLGSNPFCLDESDEIKVYKSNQDEYSDLFCLQELEYARSFLCNVQDEHYPSKSSKSTRRRRIEQFCYV